MATPSLTLGQIRAKNNYEAKHGKPCKCKGWFDFGVRPSRSLPPTNHNRNNNV